jgi:uncharacterized protein (TIGR02147 family)
MKISPFHYTDYHKFLNDRFKAKKRQDTGTNYLRLCESTGIKSQAHLSLVLNGKANLSMELAQKIAEFFRLKKRETEYFLAMIRFNHEKRCGPKMELFKRLTSFRESAIYRVGPHQYKFYARWYHSVIRALLEFVDVKDDFKKIANMVVPPIRPDQARSSIGLLLALGLAERDANGFFRPTQKSLDTGSVETSVTINNFMLTMLDLAKEAMDRFPRDERIFSCVTLGINQKGYEQICTELREFRRRAAEIARENPADRVVQVNFQMFPVSKLNNEESRGDAGP